MTAPAVGVIRGAMRFLGQNTTAMCGLTILVIVILLVAFGPLVSPYSPTKTVYAELLRPPSLVHPFGTDSFGRDVFTRVLYGARISIFCSMLGIVVGAAIGTWIGLASGYYGGWYDGVIMSAADLLISFPSFVLALFLMFVFGFGLVDVVSAIALVYLPGFARLARNMTMLVKGEPYIQAAKLGGQSSLRIMLVEIFPNIAAPLLVRMTMGFAFGVMIEAGLSFLGLGIQPPTPSLGVIMSDAKEYFQRGPWVLTLTGTAVCFVLLGLNLFGDGLRDLLDPRLRQRIDS